jgi:hypothetical protein
MPRPWFLPLFLAAPLAAQAPSLIALPIRVNLEPLLQRLETATPRVPPGVETWLDLPSPRGAAYRFNLYRDPLVIRLAGNRVLVRAEAHYWMEVGLRAGGLVKGLASCGLGAEGHRRVYLGATAVVGLTPQWGLDVKVLPQPPEALSPCELTFLGFDLTPKVLQGMTDNLARAAQGLEQLLRDSAFLRQRAEAVWTQVQKPVEVAPGIFLHLNPERLRLGTWSSARRELTIPLELQARPTVRLGTPDSVAPRSLPPLETGLTGLPTGFRVQVDADLPFPEATEQLRRQLAGRRFDTDKGSFEVLDVAVRGEGDRAILDLQLRGKVNGRLSLAGRPVFDEARGTLRLEGLDYTLESRNWITKAGEWLFRSTLRQVLGEKANWFMDKGFRDLRGQVEKGLNRTLAPGLTLSGTLEGLRLGQPRILADRFRVEASLEGRAEVAFSGAL